LLSFGFSVADVACFADGEKLTYGTPKAAQTAGSPMFLQGGVQTTERIPQYNAAYCPRINGFQAYQQAWYLLGQNQYKMAADYFQMAGDQMEAAAGDSKFLAEARFAEAQTRKLMGQYDRAYDMYKRASALFEKCDPNSFYLGASKTGMKEMQGILDKQGKKPLQGNVNTTMLSAAAKKQTLKEMPNPNLDKVGRVVKLSSRCTKLDTGTDITTLKNGDFFNRSRGTIPEAAGVDISEAYLKDVIKKAWLKMNCQETGAVGATHYSAPLFYMPIMTSEGKPIAVGAGSDLLCPTAEISLNGKNYKVSMDLPNISPNTRNVVLVTDDKHVLAIDPRTSEAWKLQANFSKKIPDFSWYKLGRQKGRKFS
jgi:hypothetical protein